MEYHGIHAKMYPAGRTHGAGCGKTLAALRRSLGAACHRAASAAEEMACSRDHRMVVMGHFPNG